jgi:hypothetical protein
MRHVNTLKLNVEELEQRIAPDPTGAGVSDPPHHNQVRPPFFVLPEPVA